MREAIAAWRSTVAAGAGRRLRDGQRRAQRRRPPRQRGDWDTAVAYYRQALGERSRAASTSRSRSSARRATRRPTHVSARAALEPQDQLAGAAAEYRLAADLDPSNTLAITKALELERKIRDQIEASRPQPRIDELRQQAAQTSPIPRLDPRTPRAAAQFPNAAVRDLLTLDRRARPASTSPTTRSSTDSSAARTRSTCRTRSLEDVLNQVLSANTLTFKVIEPEDASSSTGQRRRTGRSTRISTRRPSTCRTPIRQEIVQILNTDARHAGPGDPPDHLPRTRPPTRSVVRATAPVMGDHRATSSRRTTSRAPKC